MFNGAAWAAKGKRNDMAKDEETSRVEGVQWRAAGGMGTAGRPVAGGSAVVSDRSAPRRRTRTGVLWKTAAATVLAGGGVATLVLGWSRVFSGGAIGSGGGALILGSALLAAAGIVLTTKGQRGMLLKRGSAMGERGRLIGSILAWSIAMPLVVTAVVAIP